MRVLLDTHIFIWAVTAPESIPAFATPYLDVTQNDLYLSTASVWEIQIKLNLGKLNLNGPLSQMIQLMRLESGLQILPIQLSHVFELSRLPHHHRDPFDRLLIAQSRFENLPILTVDSIFSSYDVPILN